MCKYLITISTWRYQVTCSSWVHRIRFHIPNNPNVSSHKIMSKCMRKNTSSCTDYKLVIQKRILIALCDWLFYTWSMWGRAANGSGSSNKSAWKQDRVRWSDSWEGLLKINTNWRLEGIYEGVKPWWMCVMPLDIFKSESISDSFSPT